MSDTTGEIARSSEPARATPEQRPIPENKSRFVQKALSQFDGVTEGAKRLRVADEQFVQETKLGKTRLQADAGNASPSEAGYHQVMQAIEQMVGLVESRLEQVSQQAQMLGVAQEPYRAELEAILTQAAMEINPIKAYALAQDAIEKFDKAITELGVQRNEAGQLRHGIAGSTQENAEYANSLYARVAAEVRQNLDGGLVHRYSINSRGLAESAQAAVGRLSAEDQRFLTENASYKTMFKSIVDELTSTQDSTEADPISGTIEQVRKETGKTIEDIMSSIQFFRQLFSVFLNDFRIVA